MLIIASGRNRIAYRVGDTLLALKHAFVHEEEAAEL